MMPMHVSVPEPLAREAWRRDLPVSGICQRALRDEITRRRELESTGDIKVFYEEDHQDADPATWPGWDITRPTLVYGHSLEHGFGWTLYYELGARPGDNPDDYFIPGGPVDLEWSLRAAREHLQAARPPWPASSDRGPGADTQGMAAAEADDDFGPGSPRQYIALIPGGGWMVWRGGYSVPVLAWALQPDGDLIALETDDDGRFYAHPVDQHSPEDREVWHPDSSSSRAQMRLRQYRQQFEERSDV
jgi:hypothetical protein